MNQITRASQIQLNIFVSVKYGIVLVCIINFFLTIKVAGVNGLIYNYKIELKFC